MKRCLLLIGVVVVSSSTLHAQVPVATPGSRLGFSEDAADLPTAQNYIYKTYLDNSIVGVIMGNVMCTGASTPFQCVGDWPPTPPGNHVLIMTATNAVSEGPPSAPFPFVFVVNAPTPPTGLHVVLQ